MQQLAAGDPHVVAVNLSRNHGHQLALTAGLDLCRGEHDPDHRRRPAGPARIAAGDDGDDAASSRPTSSMACARAARGETAFKRATAHGFYRLLSRATEVDIPLDTGDFRLMSRRALDALAGHARAGALHPRHGRLDRLQAGAVRLRPRTSASPGETKYPLKKMMRFAFDALTGFSSAPLKLASHAGLCAVARLGAADRSTSPMRGSPGKASRAGPR